MSVKGQLTRDGWLLFATRCSRMFAYGLLSVVLVLYLVEVGLQEWEVGLLLTLTLAGDTAISLWLTRLMSTLLFGITPTDPVTFAGISALLAVVALGASYLPSRRAMALDPMAALRHD